MNQTAFARRLAISEYKDIAVEEILSRKAANPGKTPALMDRQHR